MFNPLGLFRDVVCPEGSNCPLLNCIFSHAKAASLEQLTQDAEPARKRRRVEGAKDDDVPGPSPPRSTNINIEQQQNIIPKKTNQTNAIPIATGPSSNSKGLQSVSKRVSPPPARSRLAVERFERNPKDVQLKDASRGSQPTPQKENRPVSRPVKKETLNPRQLANPPASHAVRLSILTKLHAAMVKLNEQVSKDRTASKKALVLSPDELVSKALDEEQKAAKEKSIYSNVVKLRIVKLTKMSKEEWEKDVITYLGLQSTPASSANQNAKTPEILQTGLNSQEEVSVASLLITPLKGLEKFGYVTTIPTNEDVRQAKDGIEASQGWEKCDRCNGRFQVFPGRREDGALTSGGTCTYHSARPLRPPRRKTDHVTGQQESFYPCCKETVGTSTGCTKSNTHVFKVSEVKRLAAILQFEETPRQPDQKVRPPVCFDCEMGYTTLGMELIRLTAVTWPEGKELVDVLVRPMGEVLDLNSRYSGVWPEHFAKAVPYSSSTLEVESASKTDMAEETPLRIVESPAAARALLFTHLQPETPLIGHAIDNDLNVCRIIHPTIIDTVLLFPHPAGLPARFGLKNLVKRHLDRDIQTGGDRGHDSKEDAQATGDLVRFKAGEKWKNLKRQGWKLEGGQLKDPGNTDSGTTNSSHGILGDGAGQKRKSADIERD